MFPIIFQYKFITIGGYGVMLGLGFYLGFLLFERELKLRGKDTEFAYQLLVAAIVCGIVGSKLFHILEHINDFKNDPWGMIFSGAGLSVYGGFLMAMLVIYIMIKIKKEDFLEIADISTPTLALGYCFGRMGCHVAGDGCYGIESTSWIANAYPNGIVPITHTVLPTPLFEVFFSFIVLGLIMQLRKRELPKGVIFYIYLILNGVPRFLVEFIRRNPKDFYGFSQAQVIAIGLIVIPSVLIYISYRKKRAVKA